MKLRSIVSLMLALMMAVSAFTGCGGGSGTSTDATPTTTADTAEASAAPVVKEKPMIDLTIYHWALKEFDPSKDQVAKLISDRFKVNFMPVQLEGDQLKLAAASKSLPDVFNFGVMYDVSTYNQWITQGLVRDIPDTILSKFPKTKELCESVNTWVAAKELHDNKAYHIVRSTSTDPTIFKTGWTGYFYRKDWLANVGITKPIETWDEYHQAMKAFTEGDPDKNGAVDTGGLTCSTGWFLMDTFSAWGLDLGDWISEGGKWIPAYLSDRCIEPLKYWNMMYNEGLIDPEFGNNTDSQAMQKFAGHKYGSIIKNADTWWMWNVIMNQFGNANKDIKDPLEVVACVNCFKKDANTAPLYFERADPDGNMFNADLSDEKLERYLEIHEWMLSEEANYLQLGFEGTDYKKDENGKVISFNDPDTGKPFNIPLKYPATGLFSIVSWRFENDLDPNWPSSDIRANIKELSRKNMEQRDANKAPINVKLQLLSTPSKDLATGVDYMTELSTIIMGKDPVEEAFARTKQNLLSTGIQDAIDEVNAEAVRLGINP